jgi:hypothetical protein
MEIASEGNCCFHCTATPTVTERSQEHAVPTHIPKISINTLWSHKLSDQCIKTQDMTTSFYFPTKS